MLLADACCGSSNFDRGFRDLVKLLYPDKELVQIPADHEMFTEAVGHDIKQVRRRRLVPSQKDATLEIKEEIGPPFLEGIEIEGRFAIIYSRYDISCGSGTSGITVVRWLCRRRRGETGNQRRPLRNAPEFEQ